MQSTILVAIGGALGALARYGTGMLVARIWREPFPVATWTVNLLGCFLIGVLAAWLGRGGAGEGVRYFAIIGFLGAYTTFSTFSMETVALLQKGTPGLALLNASGSVILGVLFVWLGMWVMEALK